MGHYIYAGFNVLYAIIVVIMCLRIHFMCRAGIRENNKAIASIREWIARSRKHDGER